MPSTLLNLTEARVRDAAPGEYQDETIKALRLYVSAAGTRTFGYYAWHAATRMPIRKSLGRWPALTVEKARKAALDHGRHLAESKDPKKPATEPSIRELVLAYTAKRRLASGRAPLWLEKAMERSFSDWYSRPLSSLTRPMISNRHLEVSAARGPMAATMAVKALRALYEYALDQELYAGANLALRVEYKSPEARQRVMTSDEYSKVLTALDDPEWLWWTRPFFRLLMLTGVRRSNMTAARWDEMDLDVGLWIIPAEKAKAKSEIRITLNPEAVELLRGLEGRHDEWVFPSPKKSKSGHLELPFFAWKRVLARAGVASDLTIHDIRRTFGSRLLNQGVSLSFVAEALGHKDPRTTSRHYARPHVDNVRAAVLGASL